MKVVEPSVYLIAEPKINVHELDRWLASLGGIEVRDNIAGSDSEQIVELAARRCYKSYAPGLNPNVKKVRTDSAEYHENILKSGHGSVMEHAQVCFAFENVSRVLTHELVRHRIGVAISQESLRYVRLDNLSFWVPPEIAENAEATALFCETMKQLEEAQKRLASIFDIEHISNFHVKKQLTSAFRRIAPIGLATGIFWSANFRELRHVIEVRTSEGAEAEIRLVFDKVARICIDKWPMIFGDFQKNELGAWVPKYHKV